MHDPLTKILRPSTGPGKFFLRQFVERGGLQYPAILSGSWTSGAEPPEPPHVTHCIQSYDGVELHMVVISEYEFFVLATNPDVAAADATDDFPARSGSSCTCMFRYQHPTRFNPELILKMATS